MYELSREERFLYHAILNFRFRDSNRKIWTNCRNNAILMLNILMDKSVTEDSSRRTAPLLIGYGAVITAAAFWGASGVFVKLIADNEVYC